MTRDERQINAVSKWIKNGCRGTCVWSTGTGKTRLAIIALNSFLKANPGTNCKVIVPTEVLKNQWIVELSKYNLNNKVVVEIINSAIKTKEIVDCLVIDEAHRAAAETLYQIFDAKRPKAVLGLSATFTRLDGRHKLLERYMPIIDTITTKEAISKGWLSNYKEYKVEIEVDDIDEYKEANREFTSNFVVFDFNFQLAMTCLTNIIERRKYAKMLNIPSGEMDAIVFSWNRALKARKNFVINHPKKIEITRKILEARPFSKAITFSGSIKQAEKIGIGYVVHSGKTKKKNRLTLEEFSQLSSGVINSSKALNEGLDVKGLNLAIRLSVNSSPTTRVQQTGRVIRFEEGKEAEVFTLIIKGTVEENWFRNGSQGLNYLTISESELDDVLAGKDVEYVEEEGEEIDQMFRL